VKDKLHYVVAIALVFALSGCGDPTKTPLIGRPGGPYQMTFSTLPLTPVAGDTTQLTQKLSYTNNGDPVQRLHVLHERMIHNFIVNLDFSSFAHIHHEDFQAITEHDREGATLHFPYEFQRVGNYRIVSEFTHKNRSWTKHFDIQVGDPSITSEVVVDLNRRKSFGRYDAKLSVSPTLPVAGFETEFILELARDKQPVTDFSLILGSEIHVALWRLDGRHFGHTHAYTPHMAAMMTKMHDRSIDPIMRAKAMTSMMIEMAEAPAQLVFVGPRLPMRYVFAEPGTYAMFLQCAPGGIAQVFKFMVKVVAYADGLNTAIDAMTLPTMQH